MSIHNFANAIVTGSSGQGGGVVEQSLKFNRDDITYLSRTAGSPTDGKRATWSFWIKKADISEDTSTSYRTVFYAGTPNVDGFRIGFYRYSGNGHSLIINQDNGSSSAYMFLQTNAFYRDPSAWYHFVISYDSTDATAADRVKVYTNGEFVSFKASPNTNPPLNHIPKWQVSGTTLKIADGFGGAYNEAIDAYLSDVYFIDGQALTPTSFGQTVNGYWAKKDYSGSYGANGFKLHFRDDVVSEGFNAVTYRGNGGTQSISGLGLEPDFVWIKERSSTSGHVLIDTIRGVNKHVVSSSSNTESTLSNGLTSFDADGFSIGDNGAYNQSGETYVAWVWDAGTSTDLQQIDSTWDTSYSFSTTASYPGETFTYTADVTGTYTVDYLGGGDNASSSGSTGISSSGTLFNWGTHDISVNGVSQLTWQGAYLTNNGGSQSYTRQRAAQNGSTTLSLTAGDTITVTFAASNSQSFSGTYYQGYQGAPSATIKSPDNNTDGSTSSRVKANPDYGFSIVGYEGSSSASTIGHGLSNAPEFIIVKNRDAAFSWTAYHNGLDATSPEDYYIQLDSNGARTSTTDWNNTAPTNSVFSVNGAEGRINRVNESFIAYCFHSVAGYSSIGSYSGTDSAGVTVTTGFRPAFVMIKATNIAENWVIIDNTRNPANPANSYLNPNTSSAEVSSSAFDIEFTDTGFVLNGTDDAINGYSGGTGEYIYAAFADTREAAFWKDVSGENNNNWTPNNLDYRDSLIDSPANNFATLNPLQNSGGGGTWFAQATLSEGNLKASLPANSVSVASMKGTGKLYAEVLWTTVVNELALGLIIPEEYTSTTAHPSNTGPNSWRMAYHGYSPADIFLVDEGTSVANPAQTVSVGDIFQVAWDTDSGNIWFGYNNSWYDSSGGTTGNPSTGANPTMTATSADLENSLVYIASGNSTGVGVINFGQDSTFAGATTAGGNTDDNGIGDFKYAPPTGYLALCTANLPTPAIIDGSEHFNTVLYSATAGAAGSVTGYGFAPDWLWTKARNAVQSHQLFDNVRGDNNIIYSNLTNAESAQAAGYFTLEADGFNYGTSTFTSNTYVGWGWKAGGTAVSNTDGSITSQVSANPTAGFSIVSYTGTGTSGTYGHGLGVAPNMILTKDRTDPAAWAVYVSDIGTGKYLELDQTDATTTAAAIYPSVSSTTIGVGVQGDGSVTNTSGDNYISYCFTDIDGFSKIGSYIGNGSTDGPFVYTGFRPAFVLWKISNTTGSWRIMDASRDPDNVVQARLFPDTSAAEDTTRNVMDFTSNGFKLRANNTGNNGSGNTYIYMAFAESPFKYSNAR